MKRLIIYIIILFGCLQASAQKAPKWMDKARKAVFRLTTFDAEGKQKASTTGFFVSAEGEALSSYAAFDGAARAVATDAEGREMPVSYILGANDLYDAVRFKVDVPRKTEFLPIASEPAAGTAAYLLAYSAGKAPVFTESSVSEAGKLKDAYGYYTLAAPLAAEHKNAPWLLADGQVFALAQEDASGKKQLSYGLSAAYAASLSYTNVDAFNNVYTRIGIRKAWPPDAEQAAVSLFLLQGSQSAADYLATLNDFTARFPQYDEGYLSRASHYALRYAELEMPRDEALALALADLIKAEELSANKSQALYKHAQLIYNVALADTSLSDPAWMLPAAAAAVGRALAAEESAANRLLEGDIYFAMGDYAAAHLSYMAAHSNPNPAYSYYMAAKSLENVQGAQISDIIALLDSAIIRMGRPTPSAEAAPYVLERVDYKMQLGLYAEAVADYDLYYYLVNGKVNDRFYYFREQARFRLGDNEGALNDIAEALRINPQSADYHAEEAAIRIRLENYEAALKSLAKAIEIRPDFGACYRLQGVCYVRQKQTAEACRSLRRAEELGDPLSARLIREHCK
jgi:tetratricopeptide (TPR) repeat protein